MCSVKTFLNTKEHLKGGMSLYNTFYKCSTLIDDTFGKIDVFTTQGDKQLRSNKPTKEFQKFLLAFEVVEALPSEFDKISEDLEISIMSRQEDWPVTLSPVMSVNTTPHHTTSHQTTINCNSGPRSDHPSDSSMNLHFRPSGITYFVRSS